MEERHLCVRWAVQEEIRAEESPRCRLRMYSEQCYTQDQLLSIGISRFTSHDVCELWLDMTPICHIR